MKSIRFIFTIAFVFGCGFCISAQEKPSATAPSKEAPVSQAKTNTDRLKLTAEEIAPFKEISKKYQKKQMELRESNFTKEEKIAASKQNDSERDAEVQKLLTAEQFKVYKEIVDESRVRLEEARLKHSQTKS